MCIRDRKSTSRYISRQALHAYRLSFIHPIAGQKLCLEAPLPEDMKKLLSDIGAVSYTHLACAPVLKQSSEKTALVVVAEKAVNYHDKYYEPYQVAPVVFILAVAIFKALILTLLLTTFHSSEIVSHKKPPYFIL